MIAAKWGGSLVTNKGRPGPARFRAATAKRLARELRQSLASTGERGLLVHGAGSWGHPYATRHEIGRRRFGPSEAARHFAVLHGSVAGLQARVIGALRVAGLRPMAVPALAFHRGLAATTLAGLAPRAGLAVTGGDVVPDASRGLRIVSGDDILVDAALKGPVRRVVFATNVDGVFLRDRLLLEVPPKATPSLLRQLVSGHDATGGMRRKVAAAHVLQSAGVEAWIVNGNRPRVFRDALSGAQPVGTRFPPRGRIKGLRGRL